MEERRGGEEKGKEGKRRGDRKEGDETGEEGGRKSVRERRGIVDK